MANNPNQLRLFDTPELDNSSGILDIDGLKYIPDFISSVVHDELLAFTDSNEWRTDLRRRVQHYGYLYDYKSRSADYSRRIGELPLWLADIAKRLQQERYFDDLPDQVIVNEYEPGQGISDHIDCVPCFTEVIASLSLGSACVVNFTHRESRQVIPVLLESRSLVVLQGAARYEWMHGIPARKSDIIRGQVQKRSRRVSLTFRKVILREGSV